MSFLAAKWFYNVVLQFSIKKGTELSLNKRNVEVLVIGQLNAQILVL